MTCPECSHIFTAESLVSGRGRALVTEKAPVKEPDREGEDIVEGEDIDDDSSDADLGTSEQTSQTSTDFTLADMDGIRILSPWLVGGRTDADRRLSPVPHSREYRRVCRGGRHGRRREL